jgi:hypothetical protein
VSSASRRSPFPERSAGSALGRARLLPVFVLPAGLCAAWTVFAGKDLNWDLLNYHYYLPFQLVAGRLQQDFYAASAQSYLNPVGYVPFYLMVSAGWHSVIASVVLAIAHSSSIALLYLIAWKLFAHLAPRQRAVFSSLASALGVATGVFWPMVGSSFLDPLLAPLVLAGLLVLLTEGGVRHAALAGALFGAATALKYSNAVFVLAAFPLALAMPVVAGKSRWRAAGGYAFGAALAIGLLAGPWLALMQREFGNPVFPLGNAAGGRFMLQDLAGALAFPFRMIALDRNLYSETCAPDLRLAALLVAAAALPLVAGLRRVPLALSGTDWRVLAFLFAAGLLWLATSANARYGLVVLVLAGVCLARMGERLLPLAAARVTLALLLLVQLGTTIVASPTRWFLAEPWTRHWLAYDVPEPALLEPALYLTLEILPMAVVAPFVHPASAFVNFRGQHSLPPASPRLASLLERHRGKVRALGRGLELVEGRPRAEHVSAYDDTLVRIGYRVDPANCFTIAWRRDGDDLLSRAANRLAGPLQTHEPLSVVSCALRPATRDPADVEREMRASMLFDRIEKGCRRLFRGHTAVTEPLGRGWSRYYSGLDARLEAYGDRVVLNRFRSATYFDLGPLSDWQREGAARPAACGGQLGE